MDKSVIVYTSTACSGCNQVLAYLEERNIPFEKKDVSTDADAMQELIALGYMTTPVTVVDGRAVPGFNRKRLEALVAR